MVVRLEPANWATVPFTNPVPLMVSVRPAVPTSAEGGDKLVMVGVGATAIESRLNGVKALAGTRVRLLLARPAALGLLGSGGLVALAGSEKS